MSCKDWLEVYREERRRPGYVLQNGRSTIKRAENRARKSRPKLAIDVKRKAA